MAKEVAGGVYFQKNSGVLIGQVLRIIRECEVIRNLIWEVNQQILFV